MSERVTVSVSDSIARVRLNRPAKHNALDMEMFRAIVAAQKQLARLRSLRAVICCAGHRTTA